MEKAELFIHVGLGNTFIIAKKFIALLFSNAQNFIVYLGAIHVMESGTVPMALMNFQETFARSIDHVEIFSNVENLEFVYISPIYVMAGMTVQWVMMKAYADSRILYVLLDVIA